MFPSGKFLLGNLRAATLFEQPYPLTFLGQDWSTIHAAVRGTHPDGRPFLRSEWPLARTVLSGDTILDQELQFTRTGGSQVVLSMSASPIRNVAGESVAAVAAFWDVTERKRAEASLRDSEARFRMLVESAHDFAIFMLDEEGRVVSWNQGAARVTGYSEEDILGKPVALLFTPEDRANRVPEEELRRAAASGRALDERWHMRRDGARFWASGAMTVARDANGRPHGFVKVMRDQTERKEADVQLQEALQSARQLRARAEGANRAKDEFISTVSHELRTPLNTIRLWSRMFVDGKVPAAQVIEGGKTIDRAALAQQQLIEDLLDVSRMASGQLRLAMRDTLLIDAVGAAVEAIRPLADSRRIDLTTDLSGEVGIVHVDPDRIQQVVWNLLADAVKFTPEGGHVDLRVARVDGTVEIEVRDTGIGIRADFLTYVFDRFRQAEPGATRRFGGLGLGLAIGEGEGRGASRYIFRWKDVPPPKKKWRPLFGANSRASEAWTCCWSKMRLPHAQQLSSCWNSMEPPFALPARRRRRARHCARGARTPSSRTSACPMRTGTGSCKGCAALNKSKVSPPSRPLRLRRSGARKTGNMRSPRASTSIWRNQLILRG